MQRSKLIHKVSNLLHPIAPEVDINFYGSQAKENVGLDSDIGLLIVVDKDKLIKAKENPDQYRNLVVRVCGYSAPFISLSEELQDEIIQRALRNG